MPVRKRFGQHFLHDPGTIRRIVESIAPKHDERIVEIGPGRGAITWPLLEQSGKLLALEIDRDLAAALTNDARAAGRLEVRTMDVLRADFTALRGAGPALRVIGNLPYNISTPLLFHLLGHADAIEDMHFMLQREVVQRMSAQTGSKEYGRLTVMLAAVAEVEHLFDVGPGAFRPPPKVWSAVVRLRPARAPRFAVGGAGVLKMLTTAAFSHRRKTLRNGLKDFLGPEDFKACDIDPQRRPETLTPLQFGLLATHYTRLYSKPNGSL